MRKYIKGLAIGLVLCLLLAGMTAAESSIVDSMDFQGDSIGLSLDEAIEVMLESNPTLEKSKLDLEQAQVDYDKYEKDYRRVKRVFGSEDKDSLKYLQSVKLLEISGEYAMASARRNYDATLENLKADMEQAYYRLLQAERMTGINKANVETTKDLHEKTKKKFELGLVAKQEVINSELSLIRAENDYNSSQNNLKNAKMLLNTRLGYDIMKEVNLTEELSYREFEVQSIAEAISKALENRNEIKFAEFNYNIQKTNMDIAEKIYSDFMFDYRSQKLDLEKATRDLEDIKKNIEMEVRSNYLDVLQKQEEIKAGEKSVELAKEALRLSQLSYDVGMSVMTDIQRAQTALLQSELGLSQAVLDYNLCVLKFEDAIGVGRTSIGGSSAGAPQGGGF